jgi:glutaryl-CoA dehydrogenase (non-decarboxylating)
MKLALTPAQEGNRRAFRTFAAEVVAPQAAANDEAERLPPELIRQIADARYLGAVAPAAYGGLDLDPISFGLLCEAFGSACASARSLLTVHSMVLHTLLRWGSAPVKEAWARRLVAGEAVAAFALTEPDAGSDARSLKSTAVAEGEAYVLNGHKKWITFGQVADIFLLFVKVDDEVTAFLVERDCPGLRIEPIRGLSGCRASMLAELRLENCRVPAAHLVGRPGFGWSAVAAMALDHGRYSVAWGCVGLAQACLEASLTYAGERRQFGAQLVEHQLVQQMLTDMATGAEAARLLCYRAGYLRQESDPGAVMATSMAKYFAASTAGRTAADAVQIHGANGFTPAYNVERHWRDAKVMEIIEGSTQIQQMMIARGMWAQQRH